jgi:hypothetical protein
MNPLHKEIVPVTTWQKVTFWFFVNLFPRNIAMMKENFFQNGAKVGYTTGYNHATQKEESLNRNITV